MKMNVTWQLEAGVVGQEEAAIARQQYSKHISTAISKDAKLDKLLEAVFSL
jgi:hypothetical protein